MFDLFSADTFGDKNILTAYILACIFAYFAISSMLVVKKLNFQKKDPAHCKSAALKLFILMM